MSTGYGPKIVTDGLQMYLDSTVERSYSAVTYGSELVTEPTVLTAGDGQVKTISSIGGNYINFLNIAPCVATKRYRIIWTISARRGTTTASFGPSHSPSIGGAINLAPGTYSRTFTCNSTGNFSIACDNVGTDFDLDYLSIKEVLPSNSNIIYDLSGNNNHFNIGGGVYSDDKSLFYASSNTYAYENTTNNLAFTDNMTIDMWLKPTSFFNVNSACGTTNGYSFFSKQGGYNGPSGPLYTGLRAGVEGNSNRVFFNIAGSAGSSVYYYYDPVADLNRLYNFIFQAIVDGNNQTLIMYVNGELIATSNITQNYSHPTDQLRLAGSTNHCGNHSLFGYFYSTKIYNRILNSREIKQNYTAMIGKYS